MSDKRVLSKIAYWLGCALLLITAPMVLAQSFSVSPAPNTKNAVSPPTGVDDDGLPGFYPAISIIATRHSNSQRLSDLEVAETVISVVPRLSYKTDLGSSGRHSFQINYIAVFDYHSEFSEEDSLNHTLDFGLNFDLTEKLQAGVNAAYAVGTEERSGSGTPLDQNVIPNDFESLRVGAQAIYGRRSNRMQVGVAVDAGEYRYSNNDQEYRDYDWTGLTGRVYYNVGAVTSTFLEAGVREIDYLDDRSTKDSTETHARVGVDWQPSEITQVGIAAGQTEKEFDDAREENFDGVTYIGNLFWSPFDYTTLNFFLSRAVEESPEVESSYFVSDLWGLSLNHSFSDRLSAFVFANFTQDEFNDGRKDDMQDLGIGLSYNFRPWLYMSAQYGLTDRESTEPRAIYDDQYVSLSLTALRPQ